MWLKGSGGEWSDQVGAVEPVSAPWWAGGSESQGGCTQMALGTQGRWRKAPCAGGYLFLCEKDVTGKTQRHTLMQNTLTVCMDTILEIRLESTMM